MLYVLFPWSLAFAWALHDGHVASLRAGQRYFGACALALRTGQHALPEVPGRSPAWVQSAARVLRRRHGQGEHLLDSLSVALASMGQLQRLIAKKRRVRRLFLGRVFVMGLVCALVRIAVMSPLAAWVGSPDEKELGMAAALCLGFSFVVFLGMHRRWWFWGSDGQGWLMALLSLESPSGFAGAATMQAMQEKTWRDGVSMRADILAFLGHWGDENMGLEEMRIVRLEDALAACEMLGSGLPAFLLMAQPAMQALGWGG